MTQNLLHESHVQTKVNPRHYRHVENRRQADELLREVAFVLKMTQRVRETIEAEQESLEPAAV